MTNEVKKLPKKKKRIGGWWQLLLVLGFLTFVWFSFGRLVLSPEEELIVPESLGDLNLINLVEGSTALAQIDKLHNTKIEMVSAYIAEYAGNEERVSAWVGTTENRADAAELINRMVEAIGDGSSGFSNVRNLSIAGSTIFQVDGPGGIHIFYQLNEPSKKVVWLSIESAESSPLLELSLRTF